MTFLTILAAALLSFCLFLFNPLFIYFSDPSSFGDLPRSAVLRMLLLGVVVAVGLALPRLRLGKNYTLGLCFAGTVVFLYSYVVQLNFGLFRGDRFGNEALIFNAASLAYFIEPIALVVLFFLVRALFNLNRTFFAVFFGFLFLSLSYELFSEWRNYLGFATESAEASEESRFDSGQVYRFAKNRPNIVLIIPDAGAGYVLPKLMAEDDRGSQFDGFVHYLNTVSVGSYTLSSTAALLAGDSYSPGRINERNDRTILEHINDAYNWLADTLTENNYETTFINPTFSLCETISQATFCEWTDRYKDSLEERFYFEAIPVYDDKAVRYFALFKTAPFALKPLVYESSGWREAMHSQVRLATNINKRYHEYLMLLNLPRLSVAQDAAASQFNFLWNSELISPFNQGADCQPLDNERATMYSHESRINATRCFLDGLIPWFEWMKDNGVYDNTKIIIAADHGAGDYGQDFYRGAVNPILLVKGFDSSGPLEVSDLLMQNSDVAAIICSELGGCEGVKKDPIKHPDPDRIARYYYTTHGNYSFAKDSKRFEINEVFEIQGNVHDHPEFR